MNTGMTKIDVWYNENYEMLKTYCNKYKLEEDIINETFLKIRKIEHVTGLTSAQLFMYVRRSLWNLKRDNLKLEKRKGHNISMEDINTNEIELKLEELNWNEEEYKNEIEWLTKKMFKYIEERGIFSDMEVFILKSYVWTDVTYQELEKKVGISQDICKKTMRKFRQDLRRNFLRWLNYESRRN